MNSITLAKMALRNLARNSRRTLITVLVSSAGFAALVIVAGYIDFTFYGLQELTVSQGFAASGGTGHIQVFNQNLLTKEERGPMQYGIEDYQMIQHKIESIPDVSFTMPRIEFNGLISNGEKSISFIGLGVNAKKEAALTHYWNSLTKMSEQSKMDDSSYKKLDEDASVSGILLGGEMAKALNAKTGSSLMLIGTTVDGAVNVVDVTVSGIIKNSMKSIDQHYLVVDLDTVKKLIQTDKISKIVVVLDRTENTSSVSKLISAKINSPRSPSVFSVVPWINLAEYYHSIRDAYNIIFSFTGIIVLIIVFLSCTNTMLMSTMERIQEIGTLKAIGVSNGWISLMFLFEGFFIGLLSVVGGISLKYIFSEIINNSDFIMPPPPGMSSTYFLKIHSATEYLPWIVLLIMVSTSFSGFLTLLRIRKMLIVDSLSHV